MLRGLFVVLLCGCGAPAVLPDAGDPCDAGSSPATLSRDVEPIFQMHCAGVECHAGQFSAGRAWKNLVGVPSPECGDGRLYVEPGDPNNSYLIQKVTGKDICYGVQMPKVGDLLTADQIQLISNWICAGAKND